MFQNYHLMYSKPTDESRLFLVAKPFEIWVPFTYAIYWLYCRLIEQVLDLMSDLDLGRSRQCGVRRISDPDWNDLREIGPRSVVFLFPHPPPLTPLAPPWELAESPIGRAIERFNRVRHHCHPLALCLSSSSTSAPLKDHPTPARVAGLHATRLLFARFSYLQASVPLQAAVVWDVGVDDDSSDQCLHHRSHIFPDGPQIEAHAQQFRRTFQTLGSAAESWKGLCCNQHHPGTGLQFASVSIDANWNLHIKIL